MKKLFWFGFLLCPQIVFAQPKNVIIVIGAGMGYNHIQATQNFTGVAPAYLTFPQQAGIYTLPAMSQKITVKKELKTFDSHYHSAEAWFELGYLDSSAIDYASAGTALATGRATGTAALGLGIDSSELTSVLSVAKAQNKAFGILTNTAITNSTTSAFFSKAYNASDKDTIAKQLASCPIDLIICSGNPEFDSLGIKLTAPNYSLWGSQARWNEISAAREVITIDGSVLHSPADLAKKQIVISKTADFCDASHLNYFAKQVPFLLQSLNANANGFTALIESRQIEYASRLGKKDRVIAEMQAFNASVDSAISWIETNSNWDETALIVIGAYESGMLADTAFDRAKTNVTALRKVNSKVVKGEYNFTLNSNQNTNALTPFFAKGAGTDELKYYTDQTDFYREQFTSLPEIGRIIRELHKKTEYTKPQNIILVIGDGCGRNQIDAAKYYYGKTPVFETFPVKQCMSTYPGRSLETKSIGGYSLSYSSERAWGKKPFLFGYNNVTCSASSGLAMASGRKTFYYGMGLDLDFNALNTIAQHAKSLNKSAGVVTTETINNATPSVFASHNISRKKMGQISLEMLIESQLDVLIGAGHPEYDNDAKLADSAEYDTFNSKECWEALKAGDATLPVASNSGWTTVQDIDGDGNPDPWRLITENTDFKTIGTNTPIKRLLGVPHVPISLQQKRSGDVNLVNLTNKNDIPHLSTLAKAGLNVLNNNKNGFFVMIEAGAIDQACHSNQKGRMLEEVYDLFTTVDSVVDWIEKNGGWEKNLLIVTADHETGLLTGSKIADDTIAKYYQIKNNGAGVMPEMVFNHKDHSNQLVNLYAKGAGAEILNEYADEYDFFLGSYLTNSEIGESMFKLWNGTPATIRNRPPVVVKRVDDQVAMIGKEFTFTIPQESFADSDDKGTLRFDATIPNNVADWLKYDKATSTFSGIPTKTTVVAVQITAFDGATTGAAVSIATNMNLEVVPYTSVSETDNTNIAYPSPASTSQSLHYTANCNIVRMINALGTVVFETTNPSADNTIDIGTLPRGTYMLQFVGTTTENQTIVLE